jgi:glutamate--cysteine ligase
MNENKFELLKVIKSLGIEMELVQGSFGLEKENIRVDKEGRLALTPHPKTFGSKLSNPYIITDFSESQIEMITPTFTKIEECYKFLENIHRIVLNELDGEYLWPQSMPPNLPEEQCIPVANYEDNDDGNYQRQYRNHIAEVYGKKKLLISGIHYNFSFVDSFLEILYKGLGEKQSFKNFKDDIYLKICRNFFRYSPILIYLFGASPSVHSSFDEKGLEGLERINENTFAFSGATSMRNSDKGYRNLEKFMVSYKSVENYAKDITALVELGLIQSPKEYYSPIRLKTKRDKNVLKYLLEKGIDYIELRFLDLNPLSKIGVDLTTLKFIHLFILYALLKEEENKNIELFHLENSDLIASFGRQKEIQININNEERISFKSWAKNIINEMKDMVKEIGINEEEFSLIIKNAEYKIEDEYKSNASIIYDGVKEKNYIDYHMDKAIEYADLNQINQFNLLGYEDLELSTQILLKDAIKRGIKVEVIDRNENFIMLSSGDKVEYIKQATKTSLDSYATVLIMENKSVTKMVLEKNNVRVPKGKNYDEIVLAKNDYKIFEGKPIVIKPKSTNFGLGITIFKEGFSQKIYNRAVDIAFSHDSSIIIEEFIEGKEYRIFVIGDQVVGILHRVPANVCGDGEKNIRELVYEKNKDPLRGKGYKTPLEKINLGEAEEIFLGAQGYDFDYVPSKNQIVYLRENSNVSTGGDSIDYTDDIPDEYKKVAITSAKAVGATICGVDMMIKNLNEGYKEENYGIIELNFNPAIHIHCYPYKGKNRKLGDKILDILGF